MTSLSTRSHYVFVDESGDPNLDLDKDGVSKYFVVSAIILDSLHLPEAELQAKDIVKKYFQTGELKSRKIRNIKRRKKIISDVTSNIDFKIYSLVVDKSAIFTESGLKYKKSFLKYLNGKLYNPLYKSFHELHVKADEHGHTEFMESFEKYIKTQHTPRLFEQSTFEFVSSESYPLVQVADLFAGTISRCYSGSDSFDVLALFKENTIIIEQWPPSVKHISRYEDSKKEENFDLIAREQGLNLVKMFIQEKEDDKEEDTQLQVATLNYLLYQYVTVNPDKYVYTNEIINYLYKISDDDNEISEHAFRTKVIAKIRDAGVIIASSDKGYKIPYIAKDILDYVSKVNGLVMPSLNRLEMARKHILLSSKGEFEIVSKEHFPELNSLIKEI